MKKKKDSRKSHRRKPRQPPPVTTLCVRCNQGVEKVTASQNLYCGVMVTVECHGESESRIFPDEAFKPGRLIALHFFTDSGSN